MLFRSKRIKSKLRDRFMASLGQADLDRYLSVSRHAVKLHTKSHLQTESDKVESLCQSSTSLFSISSFYELSNEALVHSSALILGIPLPHATYLKEHEEKYANIDPWGDFLLNDSEHAGSSRKMTHNKFAAELSKIANECGIPTTCKESQLPYRDEGRQEQSRKRADMMTFGGGCVRPNQRLNFTKSTRLIMDVTIGHVFDTQHNFKRNNIHSMETRKRNKYAEHYQQQRLAFAPIVANTLGQCGPDCLQFLWILADHAVKTQQHPETDYLGDESPTSAQSTSSISEDYRHQRGRKFHENRLRLLTHIYEGVTERIYGTTFALSNSAQYRQWLRQTRHNWQPMIPDHDLSPQSTESMPSSQAETLSMEIDSPRASLVSHYYNTQSRASQHTIPLESQQSRSSQPQPRDSRNESDGTRLSKAPAGVIHVVDVVNNAINPGGGGHRRRSLQPSSNPEQDEATRPARRRRIHELSPTLSYIHTHTLTTPYNSEHCIDQQQ